VTGTILLPFFQLNRLSAGQAKVQLSHSGLTGSFEFY